MADLSVIEGPAAPSVLTGRAGLVRRASDVAGPAVAPTLVLLHGTRRTRDMWRHQVADLSDTLRVVAPDLPGHGTLADTAFTLRGASDFVVDVIEEIAGGRAIIVGQSLGGYVGMHLAARLPRLVAGLVIANASAEPRAVARRAPRTVGSYLLVAATDLLRRPALRPKSGDGVDPGGPGDDGDGSEPPATNGWLFKGGTRALVSALREAFVPQLARYPGPTLLLNGADDVLFRRSEQEFLAAAAHGRLEVIAGCGHLVNEEQPEAFNAALRRFAAEVAARDAQAGLA